MEDGVRSARCKLLNVSGTTVVAIAAVLCATFASMACLHRRTAAPALPTTRRMAVQSDFVDLQPGWKVRVVVPMLRSGGYVLPSLKTEGADNTMELKAGDDLLGYEKAYYKISRHPGGGIRIRFSHAEVWEKGRAHRHDKPLLDLFEEATGMRHVRLVYLIRESKADHNMAIVASDDPAALDELTHAVTRRAECNSSPNASCRWVPNGIAVAPEAH